MVTLILVAAAAAATAPARNPPSEARVVEVVFANLAVAFDPEQSCSKADRECTVGEFLQKTLVFLAQSERDAPQRSWETAKCTPVAVDAGFLEGAVPPKHSPKLAPRLERYVSKRVWSCALAFGYHEGEVKWSREVGFLLADDAGHSLIADSFRFHSTP